MYRDSIFSPSQNLSSSSWETSVDLDNVKYFSNINTQDVIDAITRIPNMIWTGKDA
jgi:hypothetical protein